MGLSGEIEKSFPQIEKLFDETEVKKFIKCNYKNLYIYHFSLGMWIRNNILQKNNDLTQLFIQAGITHIDDMSELMIKQFYIYMKDKYKYKKE